MLIATPPHAELITAARRRGQLVVLDAGSCLDQFMVDGRPDPEKFFALVWSVLDRVVQAGYGKMRLSSARWWSCSGATTSRPPSSAYRIDNFDRRAHRSVLRQLSRSHSHLVPVDDYERFERAVDDAYREVFGAAGEAGLLRELLGRQDDASTAMPPAQAALHDRPGA